MSWFDKAKDLVDQGLEEVQNGLETGLESAKQGIEQGVANVKESAAEVREEKRAEHEEIRRRRRVFRPTARSKHVQADLKNGLWRLNSGMRGIYPASDLAGYELIQDGDVKVSGGIGIGRAIVGGVLIGGVGAVLGGLSKKKKVTQVTNKLQIRISNSSHKKPATFITLLDKKTKHSSKRYKKAMQSAQETLGVLDMIASYQEEVAGIKPVIEKDNDNLDKIRQLKGLLDEGVITQEEFEKKKEHLLF